MTFDNKIQYYAYSIAQFILKTNSQAISGRKTFFCLTSFTVRIYLQCP